MRHQFHNILHSNGKKEIGRSTNIKQIPLFVVLAKLAHIPVLCGRFPSKSFEELPEDTQEFK